MRSDGARARRAPPLGTLIAVLRRCGRVEDFVFLLDAQAAPPARPACGAPHIWYCARLADWQAARDGDAAIRVFGFFESQVLPTRFERAI